MKTYRLHWRNGIAEDIEGTSPEDAFNRAGIGAGALSALDYWEELSEPKDEAATAGTHAPAPLEQAHATEEARMMYELMLPPAPPKTMTVEESLRAALYSASVYNSATRVTDPDSGRIAYVVPAFVYEKLYNTKTGEPLS